MKRTYIANINARGSLFIAVVSVTPGPRAENFLLNSTLPGLLTQIEEYIASLEALHRARRTIVERL